MKLDFRKNVKKKSFAPAVRSLLLPVHGAPLTLRGREEPAVEDELAVVVVPHGGEQFP